MSRLYVSATGDESTQATRQGHRRISAHPRGHTGGIRVDGYVDGDWDVFTAWITSGSGRAVGDVLAFRVQFDAQGHAEITDVGSVVMGAVMDILDEEEMSETRQFTAGRF